jgi:hypothetical protein
VDLETDPVDGLLRDGNHVSFNVGRYLLALTFARVLTGADADTLCAGIPLNYGTAIGVLPADYLRRIKSSVEAALADPAHITDLTAEDDTDPAELARVLLEDWTPAFALPCTGDGRAALRGLLEEQLELLRVVWPELELESVTAPVFEGEDRFRAEAELRFGYTAVTAALTGELELLHSWSGWRVTRDPRPGADGEEERVCSLCGGRETRPIPAPLPGDLNGNGRLDAEDAGHYLRAVAAASPALPDLNGDGKTNGRDGVLLFRAALS